MPYRVKEVKVSADGEITLKGKSLEGCFPIKTPKLFKEDWNKDKKKLYREIKTSAPKNAVFYSKKRISKTSCN